MRWLYHDPDNRREAAERKRILAAIDDWWTAFADRHTDIGALFGGKKKWDLVGWMHDTLQTVSPHLMWEYGPAVNRPDTGSSSHPSPTANSGPSLRPSWTGPRRSRAGSSTRTASPKTSTRRFSPSEAAPAGRWTTWSWKPASAKGTRST
jgi:hypothetical protein